MLREKKKDLKKFVTFHYLVQHPTLVLCELVECSIQLNFQDQLILMHLHPDPKISLFPMKYLPN